MLKSFGSLTLSSSRSDQRCLRLVLPSTRQDQKTHSARPQHKPRLLHSARQQHHFLQRRRQRRAGRRLLRHHGNRLSEPSRFYLILLNGNFFPPHHIDGPFLLFTGFDFSHLNILWFLFLIFFFPPKHQKHVCRRRLRLNVTMLSVGFSLLVDEVDTQVVWCTRSSEDDLSSDETPNVESPVWTVCCREETDWTFNLLFVLQPSSVIL